jgi:hypothetical protein
LSYLNGLQYKSVELNLPIMAAKVLSWLDKKRGAIFRLLVRKLKGDPAVPYCYFYSVPTTFIPPADAKVGAEAGLLAWHAVQAPTETRIISYWLDEQRYRFNRIRFEQTLGISAVVGWGGATGDIHGNEPTWWPSSFKEFLVAAAAVVGACTVIWGGVDGLFRGLRPLWITPNAEISFAITKADLAAGEKTDLVINVKNTTEFVPAFLTVSAKLPSADDGSVQLNKLSGQWLDSDAPETLHATLQAPNSDALSVPMDFKLSVSVHARTWKYGHAITEPPVELPVRVWPHSYSWTRRLSPIAQSNPNLYSAVGFLYPERAFPNGLQGKIMLVVPAVSKFFVDFLEPFRMKQQVPSPSAGSSKTILVLFESPPLEGRKDYQFQLTIRSGQALPDGWTDIEKSMQVFFSEKQGG